MAKQDRMPPVHPGEILAEEFLGPMGISQHQLARESGLPATRINAIVRGQRGITADTALRLGLFFGMAPETWLNLQSHYDLVTQREALGDRLASEVRPRSQATHAPTGRRAASAVAVRKGKAPGSRSRAGQPAEGAKSTPRRAAKG